MRKIARHRPLKCFKHSAALLGNDPIASISHHEPLRENIQLRCPLSKQLHPRSPFRSARIEYRQMLLDQRKAATAIGLTGKDFQCRQLKTQREAPNANRIGFWAMVPESAGARLTSH